MIELGILFTVAFEVLCKVLVMLVLAYVLLSAVVVAFHVIRWMWRTVVN